MKKPVTMSCMAIIVAALLLCGGCGGTYAFLGDTALSDANTFDAGKIDLKIKDNDESLSDNISATWTSTNMKPGDDLPFTIPLLNLKNVGLLTASTLDISASSAVLGQAGQSADDMDKFMEITRMDYDDFFPTMNLLNYLSDFNGNGWKDLDDLEHRGPAGEPAILGRPAPAGVGGYSMDLRFRPEAGNAFQGMTLVTGFTFTLNQAH